MRSREGGASYGLIALGGAVVVFVGLAFGVRVAGFRINLSVSHPLGVYPVVDQEPAVGLYCGKACKDDPLGGKSASSLTHLVWLQKLLIVVQRWKGKRG